MPWSKSTANLSEVDSVEECNTLLQKDLVIFFKHSPTCPVSWMAHREVMRLHMEQPELPLYLISVRRRRDVARLIEERTGVRHESPQILVLRHGEVVGSASHDDVTVSTIKDFLGISESVAPDSALPVSGRTA